jgi:drug/metabolite transporter (DMT)-like permease
MNILLLALVPACFALNPVTGRAVADVLGPASLSVIRWGFSGLIVTALVLRQRGSERGRAPVSHLLRLGALGALGMGFCGYAAFAGVRTAPATNIALIYSCTSALVAAWEIMAGRQRLTPALGAGIAACLSGVVLVVTRGHPETLQNLRFTPGDLWATAGMLVFVLYTIILRRMPATHSALPQFLVMSCGATLALAPFAAAEVGHDFPALELWTVPWLVVAVLATGIGAYLGYNVSLTRNGPVLTSASLSLTPMFAAVLAMLLIGEQLAWYHGAALALVVAGLLLVNRA